MHIDADAAVVHQGGHSLLLGRRGRGGEAVGHVVPVVARVAEVGAQQAVARVIAVGVAAVAEGGEVPILHHLSHGRSHAAGHGVAGAVHVVRRALIPLGGHQGLHLVVGAVLQGVAAFEERPLLMGCARGIVGLEAHGANFLMVYIHRVLHGCRHLLRVDTAVERPRQHRAGTVVGRHKEPASAVGREEIDIVVLPRLLHEGCIALAVHLHLPEGTGHCRGTVGADRGRHSRAPQAGNHEG